jgi:FAD-dependent oxidoreductase domain-containing protein 1
MTPRIVIVGGGVIGSAIAAFVCADPAFTGEVVVIERDPTYARASSALSASSIRCQFSTPVNVEIGRFGIEFLRGIGTRLACDGDSPDVGLIEGGYLFLASARGVGTLCANHAVQRAHGVDVELLERAALGARFPWLATAGLALGSLGRSGEGWFDGYALLQAFRRKARALGARYLNAEAVGLDLSGDRVAAVRLSDGSAVACTTAVNAAGPWARTIAAWAGVDLPVRARRRCVFAFTCPAPVAPCPLVIDPSGVWFRPEGRGFICGVSPPAQADPDDLPLEVDHALFDTVIWPALAARVPAFEALRVGSSWAGYYEYNTFDQNGIVGTHPAVPNLVFANGFSGHGIQQSPAVGRGVAELVVHGTYRTLDLGALAYARVLEGRPLRELNVI